MPARDFAGRVMASSRSRLRQVIADMTGVLVVQVDQGPRRKRATCPGFGGWSGALSARVWAAARERPCTILSVGWGPDGRSHDSGQAVTGQQAAGRHVVRVEEFLPCPAESVWRVLTDPDLIARWLMPNEFRLEAGHRFAIDSDPIRRCGLGGTGHCEVLALDAGKMLRIAWGAAHENMSGLDSTV
jgi:hypothetical protein